MLTEIREMAPPHRGHCEIDVLFATPARPRTFLHAAVSLRELAPLTFSVPGAAARVTKVGQPAIGQYAFTVRVGAELEAILTHLKDTDPVGKLHRMFLDMHALSDGTTHHDGPLVALPPMPGQGTLLDPAGMSAAG